MVSATIEEIDMNLRMLKPMDWVAIALTMNIENPFERAKMRKKLMED